MRRKFDHVSNLTAAHTCKCTISITLEDPVSQDPSSSPKQTLFTTAWTKDTCHQHGPGGVGVRLTAICSHRCSPKITHLSLRRSRNVSFGRQNVKGRKRKAISVRVALIPQHISEEGNGSGSGWRGSEGVPDSVIWFYYLSESRTRRWLTDHQEFESGSLIPQA